MPGAATGNVTSSMRLLPAAVAVVSVLITASSSAAPVALPRATADRPDDVAGPQIHALYVLPSDGVDRALDTDGTVAASVANWQGWFRGQTGGDGLRLDTSGGELDVTFVRLRRTDAELAARGLFIRDAIEEELRGAGLLRPSKVYATYYDGSSTAACGGGAWPPTLPGSVAAVYMRATYGRGFLCYEPERSRGGLQIMDFAVLHEVLHTMGFVPTCAKNHTRAGHVSDSPTDIMYAGDESWQPAVLDVGRDDYYHAHILDCRELSESAFLDQATATAEERLMVAVTGPGRVVSAPRGISCRPRCSAAFTNGTRLTLRAVPAKGTRFVGWSGACRGTKQCHLTLVGNRTVRARFKR